MGTHGCTGIKHALLGSIAEKIVRHAPCPVLVSARRDGSDCVHTSLRRLLFLIGAVVIAALIIHRRSHRPRDRRSHHPSASGCR
jgi:hypothetical protein